MNMCMSVWVFCMVLTAMSKAFSSVLSMFWYPGSFFEIWISWLGLYTPEPTVLLLFGLLNFLMEE